jgi:copper homeostasis protein
VQPKLEIACFNLESALTAQQGDADRIELCNGFAEGGTTPSFPTVETARKLISGELFIMIRPRGGGFVYTASELLQMKGDLVTFKRLGVSGFVFGVLCKDGNVSLAENSELVRLAAPLPCTFHRAFDKVPDRSRALEDVISCGFSTILTSAGQASAAEGLPELRSLIQKAGSRIVIMPGGGVRSSNLGRIRNEAETSWYHSSAIVSGNRADLEEIKKLKGALRI